MLQRKIANFVLPEVVCSSNEVRTVSAGELEGKYVVFLVFHAAFNPIATVELAKFCESIQEFQKEDVEVIGICRETTFAIKEWIQSVPSESFRDQSVKIASDLRKTGILSLLGTVAEDGYPNPMTVILDQKGSIRHSHMYSPLIDRSVEETLNLVHSVKMSDQGMGDYIIPADWRRGEPVIRNTRSGIDEYYINKYTVKRTGIWNLVDSVQEIVLGKPTERRDVTNLDLKLNKAEPAEPAELAEPAAPREPATPVAQKEAATPSAQTEPDIPAAVQQEPSNQRAQEGQVSSAGQTGPASSKQKDLAVTKRTDPAISQQTDPASKIKQKSSAKKGEQTQSAPKVEETQSVPRVEQTKSAPREEQTKSAPQAQQVKSATSTEKTESKQSESEGKETLPEKDKQAVATSSEMGKSDEDSTNSADKPSATNSTEADQTPSQNQTGEEKSAKDRISEGQK